MTRDERDELVDLVAQAVIDKIEQRSQIDMLANMVVQRVLQLQAEEAAINNPDSVDALPDKGKGDERG